jgi:hypothetical protein
MAVRDEGEAYRLSVRKDKETRYRSKRKQV